MSLASVRLQGSPADGEGRWNSSESLGLVCQRRQRKLVIVAGLNRADLRLGFLQLRLAEFHD